MFQGNDSVLCFWNDRFTAPTKVQVTLTLSGFALMHLVYTYLNVLYLHCRLGREGRHRTLTCSHLPYWIETCGCTPKSLCGVFQHFVVINSFFTLLITKLQVTDKAIIWKYEMVISKCHMLYSIILICLSKE